MLKYLTVAMFAAVTSVTVHAGANAQDVDWPTKPIKFVVAASAGGTSDGLARFFAERLSNSLGQPVVIENMPGAGSVAGTNAVAQSDPDGYTRVISGNAAMAITPLLQSDMPYMVSALAAVTQTNQQVNIQAWV